MLSLELDEFLLELKEGSIKNVGAANKTATAKLYDVESIDVRPFGDERVKLAFVDDDGNEIEVALSPADATAVRDGVEATVVEDS